MIVNLTKNQRRLRCAIVFTAFAVAARAQEPNDIAHSYSHIQELNNAGAKLIFGSPDTAQILRALTCLQQSTASIARLQAELSASSAFAGQVENRRRDNLRIQAYAYREG